MNLSKWTRKETGPHGTQYYVNLILREFAERGEIFYWRSSAGFIYGVQINYAGCPDFSVLYRGEYLGIECKGYSGGKRNVPTALNENQADLYHKLENIHCRLIVIHDPYELEAYLKWWIGTRIPKHPIPEWLFECEAQCLAVRRKTQEMIEKGKNRVKKVFRFERVPIGSHSIGQSSAQRR
jgi:hypothetical protein